MPIEIASFFDPNTATFTHIITDKNSLHAAVVDSVMDYNIYDGISSTQSADKIIEYIKSRNLKLEWILETHIHADHLSAATYIKSELGGKIGIGSRINEVINLWVPVFNTHADTPFDCSQFDKLFEDNEVFTLGSTNIKVMHTPGHTPACLCYYVDGAVFIGDTLFMPDVGTARTDFPGGGAKTQYHSIQRILSLPDDTRIYCCHDYPPEGRQPACVTTVAEEKSKNILINSKVSEEQYIKTRDARDHGKPVPKLLFPSIQVNIRAGSFGKAESNNVNYIKTPVNLDLKALKPS